MVNRAKAAGTAWESEIVQYLKDVGLPASRTGSADMGSGDIHAAGWTIEAKAEKVIDLPGYLRQLAEETARAGRLPYKSVAWVKNRRHGIKDAYAVMSGQDYRSLMVYVESLEVTLAEVTMALNAWEQEAKNA